MRISRVSWRSRVPERWSGRPCGPALLSLDDHAGADRAVGALVDQDEAAGGPVAAVLGGEPRPGGAQPDPPDPVGLSLPGGALPGRGVHVEPVLQAPDHRAGG